MAVDETINNLIKELKQERKSHHKVCRYFTQKLIGVRLVRWTNGECARLNGVASKSGQGGAGIVLALF